MIEITKDSLTIQVTKGAYKQIYKPLGWVVSGEDEKFDSKTEDLNAYGINVESGEQEEDFEEESEPAEEAESDSEDEELLETPLSDMTLNELYRYAKLMELEIASGLSKKAAREAIRAAM